MDAKIIALEYDQIELHLALLEYSDGEKSYILAPSGLQKGDIVRSSKEKIDFNIGNAMPLMFLPLGTKVHCVEMLPVPVQRLLVQLAQRLDLFLLKEDMLL